MKCDKEMEVYSRVVGYYRPLKNWNKGKQEEFELRKEFDLHKSLLSADNAAGKTLILDIDNDLQM